MTYETIQYDVDEAVVTITLNRPEKLNAINAIMLQELADAFTAAGDDKQVRAILMTGAGRGFCSGQDLSAFQEMPTPEQVTEGIINGYQPVIGLMTTIEKPVIGAINGVAAGAGASLALACDLRVMADNGALMQAFINIGLVPDAGSTWFLARLVGYSRALEIAISGDRIGAEQCLELGLANRIVPADDLLSAAHEWAEQLGSRPTRAVGLTKHALNYALMNNLMDSIRYEAELQSNTIITDDHIEGVMAFIEKRPPQFKGQ